MHSLVNPLGAVARQQIVELQGCVNTGHTLPGITKVSIYRSRSGLGEAASSGHPGVKPDTNSSGPHCCGRSGSAG